MTDHIKNLFDFLQKKTQTVGVKKGAATNLVILHLLLSILVFIASLTLFIFEEFDIYSSDGKEEGIKAAFTVVTAISALCCFAIAAFQARPITFSIQFPSGFVGVCLLHAIVSALFLLENIFDIVPVYKRYEYVAFPTISLTVALVTVIVTYSLNKQKKYPALSPLPVLSSAPRAVSAQDAESPPA